MSDRICKHCGSTIHRESHTPSITVLGISGLYIGEAASFGEAKDMQLADLPEELREHYAGIGFAGQVLFHADGLPDDLAAKYHIGEPVAA